MVERGESEPQVSRSNTRVLTASGVVSQKVEWNKVKISEARMEASNRPELTLLEPLCKATVHFTNLTRLAALLF
jgi:hypothetical protein